MSLILFVSDSFRGGVSLDTHLYFCGPMVRHLLSSQVQVDDEQGQEVHRLNLGAGPGFR